MSAAGPGRRNAGLLALVLAAAGAACASTPAGPPIPAGPVALRIETVAGDPLTLGQLRGKVVLVTVIHTGAELALLEVPRLVALHRRHAAEGLVIVAVALDDIPQAVRVFAETFELPYAVGTVADPARFTSARGPFGPLGLVPTSVLLDRDGTIVARSDGLWPPEVLERAVATLLAADRSSR